MLIVLIMIILAPTVENILWIDVLYTMSYVKLFISMIKYAPQVGFTNYIIFNETYNVKSASSTLKYLNILPYSFTSTSKPNPQLDGV